MTKNDHEAVPEITTPEETIQLDQFLKLIGAVGTGGQAKLMIQAGQVSVNGQVETRRRRKLRAGDQVAMGNEAFKVEAK